MANPHKGEVSFEANGATYTLSFSANAIVEAEVHFGRDPSDVMAEIVGDGSSKDRLQKLRAMFWLALGDHHPDITLDETKAILRRVPPMKMAELVGRAYMLAMPEAKEGEGDANPPQPDRDGTGPASSTPGAKPD